MKRQPAFLPTITDLTNKCNVVLAHTHMEPQGSEPTSHLNPAVRNTSFTWPKMQFVVVEHKRSCATSFYVQHCRRSGKSQTCASALNRSSSINNKPRQETLKNNIDISEHCARRKYRVEASDSGLYRACMRVWFIWRRHLSLLTTNVPTPVLSSSLSRPRCHCLHWFTSTLFCSILLMSLVSLPSVYLPACLSVCLPVCSPAVPWHRQHKCRRRRRRRNTIPLLYFGVLVGNTQTIK